MASALRRPALPAAALLLLAGCQSGAPAPSSPPPEPSRPAKAAAPARQIAWEEAGDCTDKLRLLQRAARAGTLPADPDAIPVAVRMAQPALAWGHPNPDRGWIQADLPLRVTDGTIPLAPGIACWIEAGPAREIEGETREVGREQVRSAYQSGSRRERNPAYEVAKVRLRQAERNSKESGGIMSVGDPLLDLVGTLVEGVAGAFKERGRAADLEEAIATLAETQRSIEHPVWRHYHFERAVVRGRRQALVPVALVGPAARERRTLIQQRETRTFHVLDGLDPRDREYEAHDAARVSPLELERWTKEPPVVPVSALVRALLEPSSSPPAPQEPVPWPRRAEPTEASGLIAAREVEPDPPRRRAGRQRPARARTEPVSPAEPPSMAEATPRRPARVPVPVLRTHAAPAAGPPMERAAPSARAPELAVVRGQDRGLGVYLSPHTVITPARLVGDAKVLDAEVQGVLVPALVAARDPALDLALLKLPRAGYPARVDAGAGPGQRLRIQTSATTGGEARVIEVANGARVLHLKLAPGTDPAIGAPIFGGDRLVGLVVAVEGEEARAVSGSAIDALLEGLQDSDLLLD